ncbi:outer membrane beta-barrel protein [Colwellia sp. PAMC 21821]|uniref:outer membrane beta-barrel protein n=1 Tax=Colwellia sp. PAMC 21821 TaxID=1816219 RepID=UPI0009BCC8CA|nr:outer membrane beta-barrel protein [Colwellia sp. PAMC 21821]ARD44174.1 cell envelope biogenesis protein OmpA [Colwellia sp. PAMC 21821]
MKKTLLATLTATSLIATSGLASADQYSDVDHQGIYVGAGYGLLKVDSDEGFDEDDNAANAFVGAQINQAFSIEAGYIDFGRHGNQVFNTEVDGYTLALKAGLPVNDHLTVYMKGGQLWWDADINAIEGSNNVDGNDFFYGAGASIALTEGWDLRIEYTRFDIDFERDEIGILSNIESFDTDVDYASINIQYTF